MVTQEDIIKKYNELGNIWKVGDVLGLKGQYVHKILKDNNIALKNPKFTKEDENLLIQYYEEYASKQELDKLALLLGRTKQFICRKAKDLGLTNAKRKYALSFEQKEKQSEKAKKRIKKYGHPKGMLGKKHSKFFKERMSERMKQTWKNAPEIFMTPKRKEVMSKKMSDMQMKGILGVNSRSYITKTVFSDKSYTFRSNWELNIAFFLEYLKINNEIIDWAYESKRFEFPDNDFGIKSYLPDFLVVTQKEQRIIELKGRMDEKSKNKMSLMQKFYPNVLIELWDEHIYNNIKKKYKEKINVWDARKAIKNDNLCVKIVAEKFIDKENPRVEFKIITID